MERTDQPPGGQAFPVAVPGLLPLPVLTVKTLEHVYFIDPGRIIRCEAFRNYTSIILKDMPEIIASRTLKHFEDRLPPPLFQRVHQSHLVNVNYIRRYDRKQSCLVMQNEACIPVSFRKRKLLKAIIGILSSQLPISEVAGK